MTEALPADDERRTFTIVHTAYLVLPLTDPALAIAPLVRNSGASVIAGHSTAGQAQAVVDYSLHRLFPKR